MRSEVRKNSTSWGRFSMATNIACYKRLIYLSDRIFADCGRTLSVRDPRSRCYLLEGCGSFAEDDGTANSEHTHKSPQANAFCERLIGTIRRECLNFNSAHWIPCANHPEKLGWFTTIATSPFEPRTRNTGGCHFSEH